MRRFSLSATPVITSVYSSLMSDLAASALIGFLAVPACLRCTLTVFFVTSRPLLCLWTLSRSSPVTSRCSECDVDFVILSKNVVNVSSSGRGTTTRRPSVFTTGLSSASFSSSPTPGADTLRVNLILQIFSGDTGVEMVCASPLIIYKILN